MLVSDETIQVVKTTKPVRTPKGYVLEAEPPEDNLTPVVKLVKSSDVQDAGKLRIRVYRHK